MATLTRQDVARIATLAHLALSEEAIERYRKELSAVLAHVATLEAVDTDGVEPLQHITTATHVLREDRAKPTSPHQRAAILRAVPQREGDYIAVRVVQEHRHD